MLREAPKTIVARGYVRALSAAGNVVADAVEARTPIKAEDTGGLLDKGVLRESLMVAVTLDSQLRGGSAEVGFGKNGSVALWVEYGHRLVGHRPLKKLLKGVPAYPFMRPAADASADAAIAAFARSIEQTVKSEFPQGQH